MRIINFLALLLFTQLGIAQSSPEEAEVTLLQLAAPYDDANMEYSGMAWCQGKLILLPQYPSRIDDSAHGALLYLEKTAVLAALASPESTVLAPQKLVLKQETSLTSAPNMFDGFEAIACNRLDVWLSFEQLDAAANYSTGVVHARIDWSGQASLTILSDSRKQIPSQSQVVNHGDETLIAAPSGWVSVHELNDPRNVSEPKIHVFDKNTGESIRLGFPHLPYRITDATAMDSKARFWAINYKYSGDRASRNASDPIADKFGLGESHKRYYNLERLVELETTDGGFKLVDRAPIQLKMDDAEGRNWEGIVRLDNRGFLLVTDKHPKTLFGFVALPN